LLIIQLGQNYLVNVLFKAIMPQHKNKKLKSTILNTSDQLDVIVL
jgi:hypothetical protein